MVKQIIKGVAEEILETGRQTVKSAGKALSGKDFSKEVVDNLYGDTTGIDNDIEKVVAQDKKKSAEAYQRIQKEIKEYQRKKTKEMGKDVTGKEEFDKKQVTDPDQYWEKQREKDKEKKEKEITLKTKKRRGTREVRRGIGG